MQITIPDVSVSSNVLYTGLHPMKRKKLVSQWHNMAIQCIRQQKIGRWVAGYPVEIEVTCFFGKGRRIMDCDNLQATAKMSIDSLCLAGVLVDDSPRYVKSVKLTPCKSSDGRTRTEISIKKASNFQSEELLGL